MTRLLRIAFSLLAVLLIFPAYAQKQLSGVVADKSGEPIPGANVFLEGTYDGATTSLDGSFSFTTGESGAQVLVVTFIGYKRFSKPVDLSLGLPSFQILLQEEINKLDGVTITAGAFEASDEKKSVVLRPLDIAMTAGATADIAGALGTLPGAQRVGESGRLFIRGGSGNETRTFIDGMLINSFYGATAGNVPARSRFSPFLFKGTFFSTGGYSAEYGQAMSSALALTTFDMPERSESSISLMSVGGSLGHTQKWKNGSVFGELGYTNLKPYQSLVSQAFEWKKPSESLGGSFMVRQQSGKSGMLKLYGTFDQSAFILRQPDINRPGEKNRIDLTNRFSYLNATYKIKLGRDWYYQGGISHTISNNDLLLNTDRVEADEQALHFKSVFTNDLSEKVTLKMGQEVFLRSFADNMTTAAAALINEKEETLPATFAEADIYLSNKLVVRTGGRLEYSSLLRRWNAAPRASLAWKTSEAAQVSLAYGTFYQTPENERFRVADNLNSERASHYILNYQYQNNNRTFRVEGYWKRYDNLVKFSASDPFNPLLYNSEGAGYARGVDIFWRDARTFRYIDYWLSYSFLDTERDYLDFPAAATPGFASKHNFSAVYKHFIEAINSQIGASWSYGSGRPYIDPNKEGFMNSTLPGFQDLSVNIAYLFRPQVIVYASATNLLGRNNIFGYEFANAPDENGFYASREIGQPARRFLFLGVFITLSADKNANQLENL